MRYSRIQGLVNERYVDRESSIRDELLVNLTVETPESGAFAKCAGRLPGRPRVARRMFGEFFFDDASYTQPPPEKATLNLQPVFPFDPDVTPPDSFELEFGSAYYE